MRKYTAKEIKALQAIPYTLKVIKHKLFFTAAFGRLCIIETIDYASKRKFAGHYICCRQINYSLRTIFVFLHIYSNNILSNTRFSRFCKMHIFFYK